MKVVVFKEKFESTKWIEDATDIDYVMYSRKKQVNAVHIPNCENSVSYAYLKYIIDNYCSLPEWILFTNAKETDDFHHCSKLLTCKLNIHKMKYRSRYFPIGHGANNKILIASKKIAMQPSELKPSEYQQVVKDIFGEKEYNDIIKEYFDNSGKITQQSFPQGSQFIVQREKIHRRPLSFYEHCFEILTNKDHVFNNISKNDVNKKVGHFFFEAHWHIIFSEPFLYEHPPYDTFLEMPFL